MGKSLQSSLTASRLSAVLYADIHGYTRLVEQDEAGTVERLTRSLAMIRNLIGDYGGAVVNTAGDGLVAVFPSVRQALHFAIEMQRELSRESTWSGGREPLAYRVGITIGDTISGEDGVYGHSVNLAARIQELAEPGGICISDTVYQTVRDGSQLTLRSLGKKKLKNISSPVEVYAVDLASAPSHLDPVPLSASPFAASRLAPDASLAVLPLENVSGDPADLHLCQGIVADLITHLSRFRDLMVIARHSTFLAAASLKSLREIGHQLGVRYLLSGGFRRMGKGIRITVDLIEAESENIVWSERHDGSMADVFAFQDDVTATVASRVALHIDAAERRRLSAQAYPSIYAYGLILRGLDLSFRFRAESNLHARRLFEQARDIDPHYGRSYAAISRTLNFDWRYNWVNDPDSALNEALKLAKLAVEYDNLDARGYSEMGMAHLYRKEHDEALAAYEHALELNPNDADLLAEAGDCLAYVRQGKRAVELLQRAIRLNPYCPDSYFWYLGDAYFHDGEYEKTIQTVSRMRDQSEGHRLMAASHALLGDIAEAQRHAQAVMKVHPNFTIEHWRKVPPLRHAEDLEVLVEGLRKAGLR
ncbi:adenylate/guanylate cyclase domain-containing protein [Nitratireductor sp. GCM10026969]|uniref:adenylate/guanylate cyclase domain-containing protein n=1 Tax=Nitratireductor sp. GCM10026969 TaxID=3252645 RepID=UPI0036208A37